MTVAHSVSGRVEVDKTVLDRLCIYAVRKLVSDMVGNSGCGDLGALLGCAPVANALWGKIMKLSPRKRWMNRDRFVLANERASPLLYSMLHLTGNGLGGPRELTMDVLKQFHEADSNRSELPKASGLQGFANAVGMAMTERHLSARFNREGFRLFDHYTYVLAGHGCLRGADTREAVSQAGQLGLHKLIVFYEDSNPTDDDSINLPFNEDIPAFFEAKAWNVVQMPGCDINDSAEFEQMVKSAKKQTELPTIIIVRTTVRCGAGQASGGVLMEKWFAADRLRQSEDMVDHQVADLVQRSLNDLKSWGMHEADAELPKFFVPRRALDKFRKSGMHGDNLAEEWEQLLEEYCATFKEEEPGLVKELQERTQWRFSIEGPKPQLHEHLAVEQPSSPVVHEEAWCELAPVAKRQKLSHCDTKHSAGNACATEVVKQFARVDLLVIGGYADDVIW